MTSEQVRQSGRAHGVQSIDRAAAILRAFGEHRAELTLSEIARATGLTTSTVHRLLAAMQHNGLVRQSRDRRYAPGPLLVQLVRGGTATTTLRDVALPVMTALRDEVEETVGLHSLLPSDERVVIDQVECHHPLRRTYTELGIPIPLPYGAPGKVVTAFLPETRRDAVLMRPMKQVTATTVLDPEVLRQEMNQARDTGYALSFAERTPGIHTVAAAIFDHSDSVVGCLSLSGPELRMPLERMQSVAPRVQEAAWTISEILGARAGGPRRNPDARPSDRSKNGKHS
ncbi:MAG: IclR family transcriptional regulator [Nocardioidaceae bacterium]